MVLLYMPVDHLLRHNHAHGLHIKQELSINSSSSIYFQLLMLSVVCVQWMGVSLLDLEEQNVLDLYYKPTLFTMDVVFSGLVGVMFVNLSVD